MHDEPPRSAALDLAIGVVGLWLAGGFIWDSWAHLHVGVESFFTPYHGVFYSAMLVGGAILAATAVRNRRRGLRALPEAYRRAMWGVPIFFLGGVGDLIWHTIFGVEDRIEAVTSPTHLIIGFGVILFLSGPIGSALASRKALRTLVDQLPLIFSLATAMEFVRLGTSYAYDIGAARAYGPPPAFGNSPDYFTATAFALYKGGTGVLIVLVQSVILMTFALWVTTRFKTAFGFFTLLFICGDLMMAGALTNDTPLLAIQLAMGLVAGLLADALAVRLRPSALNVRALRLFAGAVPAAWFATYFALTIALEGMWWNWSLMVGSIVWSTIVGIGLSFLIEPKRPSLPGPSLVQEVDGTRIEAILRSDDLAVAVRDRGAEDRR